MSHQGLLAASDYFQNQFKTNEALQRVIALEGRTIFPTSRKWCSVHNCVHVGSNPYISLSKDAGAVYRCPSEDGACLEPVPWLQLPESIRDIHEA